MKKWMAYLPLGLLCGSLLVIGGIWGGVWSRTWSGQLELNHLEGDASALADFQINGCLSDSENGWYFSIVDGALEKKEFTMNDQDRFYDVGEKIGTWQEGDMDIWSDGVTLQPAPESHIETRQEVDLDLLDDEYLHIAPELYDAQGQLHGTTNIFDTAQAVLFMDMEAVQKKGGAFRQWSYEIPTNLLYTPGERFVQIKLENGEYKAEEGNYWRSDVASAVVWSQKQEMFYATIKTNEDCAGSIGLYCLGPRQEESFTDGSEPRRVRKEPVATLTEIPVSESRWVLGLADVEEGLLLFIGEPDGVTTELYGYDGTLLDSQKTQTAQPVHEIQMLQTDWEQGRGIYVRGSEQIDTDSYFVHFFRGYWVENGTITPVYAPEDGQGDVVWAAVGKDQVLIVQKKWDTRNGKSVLVKNTANGWALWIYDTKKDPAGRMVYHGELETDIDEDMLEYLAASKTAESKQSIQNQNLRARGWNRYLMIEDISGKGGDRVWGRNERYYY